GLEVRLQHDVGRNLGGNCQCGILGRNGNVDIVTFTPSTFDPARPREAFRAGAHEFTHRIMPIDVITPDASFNNPNSYTSPLFTQVNDILGGPFSIKRHEIFRDIQLKSPNILRGLSP